MVSIVFNFKYLSQSFIKLSMKGVHWNPWDKQIPKLFLGNQFDQHLIEKTGETRHPFPYDFYCTGHCGKAWSNSYGLACLIICDRLCWTSSAHCPGDKFPQDIMTLPTCKCMSWQWWSVWRHDQVQHSSMSWPVTPDTQGDRLENFKWI